MCCLNPLFTDLLLHVWAADALPSQAGLCVQPASRAHFKEIRRHFDDNFTADYFDDILVTAYND